MTSDIQTPQSEANTSLSRKIGLQARAAREAKGLSIRAAAQQFQCSPRFVLQFEQGKPTARMDKVLQTLSGLGLQLSVHANGLDDASESREKTARIEARAKQGLYEQKLARAHERVAAMLAPDAVDPGAIKRARGQVRKWADNKICSQWYVDQWTGILAGSGRQIALKILKLEESAAKALFQNTPFGFLVREQMRP